jgi:ComF family protein
MSIDFNSVKKHFLSPVKIFETGAKISARAGGVLLDFIYPPICSNCLKPVMKSDALCADCWSGLRPISDPKCPVLGLPFDVYLGAGALSAEAIANPVIFDRARSAFIYNDIAKSVILRFKFGDRIELAKFCASTMAATCDELLEGEPVLVPVPLHSSRQFQRQYNQANELAKQLALLKGLVVAPMLVKRIRATKQQVGLSAKQREKNVAGAFELVNDGVAIDRGKRMIIIDDVITSGATVNAVAKSLKKGGFEKIDVISFARVVNGK